MEAVSMRVVAAAVACAIVGVVPAIASEGTGKGPKRPEIRSISYAGGEEGVTVVEAGVVRASKVSVAVGLGEKRERFELERVDREAGVTFWTVDLPGRQDKCAVVVLKAKNRHGLDDRRTRVCTFGETEPEPEPEFPPALP
jgi:hypothetical protein